MSPWTIHFLVLDKSSLSGPGRCPLSCSKLVAEWRNGRGYEVENKRIIKFLGSTPANSELCPAYIY